MLLLVGIPILEFYSQPARAHSRPFAWRCGLCGMFRAVSPCELLGCGYGRDLWRFCPVSHRAIGAAGCNPVQRRAPGATGALLELGIRS